MLTTIIYRSHICDDVSFKSLESMVAAANERNGQADVTGILLFNGTHFSNSLKDRKKTYSKSIDIFAPTRVITIWWSFCAITLRLAALVRSAWSCLI